MAFDFSTIIDRTGMDAIAVEKIPIPGAEIAEGFDHIPMWVADMNFATAPSITKAIARRVEHPLFGYFDMSEDYYNAIIRWQTEGNGVKGLTSENIGYENGVLGGLVSALRAVCSPGDFILIHSPTYIGFTSSIENAGYRIILSPLKQDENGVWRMDYEDMEAKLAAHKIRTAVFCSPHNPCGRVWQREELETAMAIYAKYDCTVISDEIWSDLTLSGHQHIPTQSVSEDARQRTVALYAPSKTFNLAGLIGSYHIIYNKRLRERVEKESSITHYNSCNVLSMHALIGAYSDEGRQWLNELRVVLSENVDYAYDYICGHFKGVSTAKPEGTYMMFLDCTEWCREHGMTLDELLRAGVSVGVIWQDGRPFHGECAIRLNLALPFERLREALDRLDKYVFNK
ncbi:MAG: MalY/PatB family protein [Oscillospiraceae bacterium]